jgi:pimeloyl-ACP methyl ester carboxylesterase
MEPTGFFVIRSEAAAEPPSKAPSAPTDRRRDMPGAASRGYSARLGWIEGVPYIVDLGSAEPILVNSAPIEPHRVFLLRAGDTITVGDAHLRWTAGSGRVTAILPLEPPEPADAGEPLSSGAPPTKGAEAVPALEDQTVVVRRPAAPLETATPEVAPTLPGQMPTLRAPGAEPTSSPPQVQGPAVVESLDEAAAGSRQAAPEARHGVLDETVAIKKPAPKPEPQVLDETVAIRKPAPRPEPQVPPFEAATLAAVAPQPGAKSEQATEWADMPRLIEEGEEFKFESSPMTRDTETPCLVIHKGDQTWDAQLTKERMTIGRSEDNDICIPDTFVSRHHATIERRGLSYVIREAQSQNGVWLGRQRVQEHTLSDGDVLSLGGAKLIFKGGFRSDELTLIGMPRIDGEHRRRPVVVVPGLMGSELWLGSERLWPNPKVILTNPEIFRLPGDPRIEVRNIVNEVVIVPNIVKQRQYSGLGDYLETSLGYERGKDLLEFAYDWRQDVRLAAQRLGDAIQRWKVNPPVTILAHSLGTLVTRYYVERLGGKDVVERIILMGGPHSGTPKGLTAILVGPGMLPFNVGAERMRNVLSTFPSAYQIVPTYPCIIDQGGTTIDALEDRSWLPEKQRPFLAAARSFRRELGESSSVPAVSIFGYGFKTILRVKIERRSDGQWHCVEFVEDAAGDLSVPSGSAVLKGSEIHPVFQEHGALFVDDDVRMRLKVELTRSTTWQRRKH